MTGFDLQRFRWFEVIVQIVLIVPIIQIVFRQPSETRERTVPFSTGRPENQLGRPEN